MRYLYYFQEFVDFMDTKKGFLGAIGILITGNWFVGFGGAKEALSTVNDTGLLINVSVAFFIFARCFGSG